MHHPSNSSAAAVVISTDEAISQFLDSTLPPDALKQKASALLVRSGLVKTLQQRDSDQIPFLDKIYEVCQRLHPCRNLRLTSSPKLYPAVDDRTVHYIASLGKACSDTMRLPTSVVLSGKLETIGKDSVGSGGFTDLWRGNLSHSAGSTRVAVKAFRTYPLDESEAMKKVGKQPTTEVQLQTKFTDPLGVGTIVEEILPQKHPTIPQCRHEPLPAFPCI